jgi:hypothetical protein
VPKKETLTRTFSEQDFRRQVRRVAEEEVARATAGLRKENAEREARATRAFCEERVARGQVDPAELDEPVDRQGNRVGPLSLMERLLMLDNRRPVRKFSEAGRQVTKTARQLEMDRLAALKPRRAFAERMPGRDPNPVAANGGDVSKERVEELSKLYPSLGGDDLAARRRRRLNGGRD